MKKETEWCEGGRDEQRARFESFGALKRSGISLSPPPADAAARETFPRRLIGPPPANCSPLRRPWARVPHYFGHQFQKFLPARRPDGARRSYAGLPPDGRRCGRCNLCVHSPGRHGHHI